MENSKVIKKYPFLEEIWKPYNFDKDFDVSAGNNQISTLCNDRSAYGDNNKVNHKNICEKLLRNLKELNISNTSDNYYKHCNNLNNWLYYEIKEFKFDDSIIKKIFDISKNIVPKSPKNFDCSYFSFNNGFFETDSLAALRIFNNNSDNIKDVLEKKCVSDLCSCKKFVLEFVNLYKSMKKKYCSDGNDSDSTYKGTCDIVNEFNNLYIPYIYKDIGEKYNFPDLSSNIITHSIDGCPSEEIESGPTSPAQSNQSDRSIIQSASHALGAMAGIPPLFALIYKFTPVRKMFLSKNKKDTRAFNNLDEEIENKLFHHKYGDTNVSQMRYNLSYSIV